MVPGLVYLTLSKSNLTYDAENTSQVAWGRDREHLIAKVMRECSGVTGMFCAFLWKACGDAHIDLPFRFTERCHFFSVGNILFSIFHFNDR